MSALMLEQSPRRACLGLKGANAPAWLAAQGLEVPAVPNSWCASAVAGTRASLFVARLGASELFLEGAARSPELAALARALEAGAEKVYPVLREDRGFELEGDGVHEVLAQVCNVDFESIALGAQPIVMTLMIGVAVLVAPQAAGAARRYRLWCDPSYATALGEELATVVRESGGTVRGEI